MREDITAALQGIFDHVFRGRDIVVRPELKAADVPGWDSFRYVSLIMATEEHFGVTFADAELDEFKDVGDLMSAIARKMPPR